MADPADGLVDVPVAADPVADPVAVAPVVAGPVVADPEDVAGLGVVASGSISQHVIDPA